MTINCWKHGSGLRGRLAALPFVLLAAVFALSGQPAAAGTFHISPTLGDVPPGKATATFRIVNTGQEPLTVQITPQQWTQRHNDSVLEDTDDLLVVPPLVTVAPGQTQVVRIAHSSRDNSIEQAYRIFFHEVPPAPPEGFVGLQTVLRLSIPLFFAPETGRGELAWSARSDGGQLQLDANNRGSRFARLTSLRLLDRKGREVASMSGPEYVLAGAARRWTFPAVGQVRKGEKLTAIVEIGSTKHEFELKIE